MAKLAAMKPRWSRDKPVSTEVCLNCVVEF
jgi:hypothetical protein